MSNGSMGYFFFSFANLIAAFGGGLILGKGIGVLNSPYLQGDSILAFFIGTIIGLVFLQVIPKKWSTAFAKYFSVSCGITSLILFYLYESYAQNGQLSGSIALVFFLLLSVRFGFWFFSRVMRASAAVSSQHSVAWAELGYYSGMVLGLIIWKFLNINLELGAALIVDACLQCVAGILDFKSHVVNENSANKSTELKETYLGNRSQRRNLLQWCWKLSTAVVALTIAVQVTLFSASHFTSQSVSSWIIATFYAGVAAGAFFCSTFKLYIHWENDTCMAYVSSKTKQRVKLAYLLLIPLFSVAYVVNSYTTSIYQTCVFVFIAAFVYEVISIVLLDRIGLEEKLLNSSGMIMKTYGLLSIGAAIGFWVLGFLGNFAQNAMLIVLFCFLFFNFFIVRRKLLKGNAYDVLKDTTL